MTFPYDTSGTSPSGGFGPVFGYPPIPTPSTPASSNPSGLQLAMGDKAWNLRVTSFSSPLYGTLSSAQTKTMTMYFPIKATQPEIKFDVVFRSEAEFENFQRFVRAHQQRALRNPSTNNVVWLNWPRRNIDNWTGVIKAFKAGGMRFNITPQASFVVSLVDSMVSSRTDIASLGAGWETIFGLGMGPDSVLAPPTVAQNQELLDQYGQGYYTNGSTPAWSSSAAPPRAGSLIPNGGITTGSGT